MIGEVTLSSGQQASYYVDARRALLRPAGFLAAGQLIAAAASEAGADAVGGPGDGGDPARLRGDRGPGGLGPRRLLRPQGAQGARAAAMGRGPGRARDSCLVVEDTVTTGSSTVAAIERIREEGLEIKAQPLRGGPARRRRRRDRRRGRGAVPVPGHDRRDLPGPAGPSLKKHVLILGAGFAGLELATRLSESLADEVRVTLVDQNDSFSFGFSKLDVLFGRRAAADIRLPYSEISKQGVEFRQERVTSIDPEQRRVTTDAGSYEADILAVALGADYDLAATPGFAEGGFEYYSVEGAERLRDALPEFESGRIVIGILGHPYKCPPAPFEGALLLHDQLTERGIRGDTEIRVFGPMAAPVPITKEVSQRFLEILGERRSSTCPSSSSLPRHRRPRGPARQRRQRAV